jgi:hypothetical protein
VVVGAFVIGSLLSSFRWWTHLDRFTPFLFVVVDRGRVCDRITPFLFPVVDKLVITPFLFTVVGAFVFDSPFLTQVSPQTLPVRWERQERMRSCDSRFCQMSPHYVGTNNSDTIE